MSVLIGQVVCYCKDREINSDSWKKFSHSFCFVYFEQKEFSKICYSFFLVSQTNLRTRYSFLRKQSVSKNEKTIFKVSTFESLNVRYLKIVQKMCIIF